MTTVRPARAAAIARTEEPDGDLGEAFLSGLRLARARFVIGLPDSLLAGLHRAARDAHDLRYIAVGNEAEMPGLAAGIHLAGERAIMVMENSGIRQACEPLARFAFTHQIPMVLLMPYRGDLGEVPWWGHSHAQTMVPLLDALRIPFWFVERRGDLPSAVARSFTHAESSQLPVALILRGGCVEAAA